jgi:hypothetical protein
MSWGYWGIVAGLVAMLATFFVCVRILSSGDMSTGKGLSEPLTLGQAEQDRNGSRHAA